MPMAKLYGGAWNKKRGGGKHYSWLPTIVRTTVQDHKEKERREHARHRVEVLAKLADCNAPRPEDATNAAVRWCRRVTQHRFFEHTVIFFIFLNCVSLCCYDPVDYEAKGERNRFLEKFEVLFLAVFTAEAVLKVVATGMWAYLRDNWNLLDFVVVVTGYLVYVPGLGQTNLSAARTLRVFRPLRTVAVLPGLRKLVVTMLQAVPLLGNVLVLCGFVFAVFGIFGVTAFGGKLRMRCVYNGPPAAPGAPAPAEVLLWSGESENELICSVDSNRAFWHGPHCPKNYGCVERSNPRYGYVSFDNLAAASLTIFQCITLEHWTEVMYMTMDATTGFASIYFVLLVFVGSFFVVNLMLAVISNIHEETVRMETEAEAERNGVDALRRLSLEHPENSAGGEDDGAEAFATPPEGSGRSSEADADEVAVTVASGGADDDGAASGDGGAPPPERSLQRSETFAAQVMLQSEMRSRLTRLKTNISDSFEGNVSNFQKYRHEQKAGGHKHLRGFDSRSSFAFPRYLLEKKSAANSAPDAAAEPHPVRGACIWLLSQKWFGHLGTYAILLNTVALAMEYEGMSDVYRDALEMANLVLAVYFIAEMVVRLVGMGVGAYFHEPFNTFDAFINTLSIVEIAVLSSSSLSALRTFRILRILKLAGSWASLRMFISTMMKTLGELGNFSVIVALVILIYSLMGMQLFGGRFVIDGEVPRANFDSLLWSSVTVFQILTGEDWPNVMHDGMHCVGSYAAVYFVTLVILGNFIVVNLFIAILLNSFANHRLALQEEEETRKKKRKAEAERKKREAERRIGQGGGMAQQFIARVVRRAGAAASEPAAPQRSRFETWLIITYLRLKRMFFGSVRDRKLRMMVRVWKHNAERKRLQRETGKFVAPSFKVALTPTKNEQRAGFGAKYPNLEEFEYASFWLFGRGHPIRRLCYSVVTNRSFDHAIFFLICVSSVAMAMESPEVIDRGGAMLDALNVLDRVLTSTFIVELVLKVTAYSMVGEPGAYSSDPWNLLDFFIVLVSIVDWSLSDDSLGWIKVIRIFRVLRPLRMINRVPELKTVVNALIASFPGMGNVLIVSFLFWLIFGILGMSLFMGLFRYCSDETVSGKADCIGTYDAGQGVMEERRWLDKEANFNNIYKAMMTLFEMSTTEGWLEVLYSAADITGRDRQPRRNANEIAVPYFILFMVIGSFFLVNLFVGIILDNFAALREKGGNAHLFASERQREWVSAREKLSKNKPAPSYEAVAKIPGPRGVALRIARHPWFEYGIMLVVMLNTVFLATASADQTEVHDGVLMYANLVFTVIYIAEAALKMYAANGMRKYFKDAWNVFDFSIVIVGVVGIFIDIGGASLIRIFRVVRVLRLIRSMKSLRVLFETLFLSLPTMVNVGALMFLLFFCYAVLGVNLFGRVSQDQEFITRHANFSNFGRALLSLFRMVTGEAWNGMMYDCMIQPSSGKCSEAEGNCGSAAAPVYFMSFGVLGSFVMLNLFLAVVLENYGSQASSGESLALITEEDMAIFKEVWLHYDPAATMFIHASQILELLSRIPPPLGVGSYETSPAAPFIEEAPGKAGFHDHVRKHLMDVLKLQSEMKLCLTGVIHDDYVHYEDLVHALTCRLFGVDQEELPEKIKKKFKKRMHKQRARDAASYVLSMADAATQAMAHAKKERRQRAEEMAAPSAEAAKGNPIAGGVAVCGCGRNGANAAESFMEEMPGGAPHNCMQHRDRHALELLREELELNVEEHDNTWLADHIPQQRWQRAIARNMVKSGLVRSTSIPRTGARESDSEDESDEELVELGKYDAGAPVDAPKMRDFVLSVRMQIAARRMLFRKRLMEYVAWNGQSRELASAFEIIDTLDGLLAAVERHDAAADL